MCTVLAAPSHYSAMQTVAVVDGFRSATNVNCDTKHFYPFYRIATPGSDTTESSLLFAQEQDISIDAKRKISFLLNLFYQPSIRGAEGYCVADNLLREDGESEKE